MNETYVKVTYAEEEGQTSKKYGCLALDFKKYTIGTMPK